MSLYQAAVDLIAAQSKVLELEDQLAVARQEQYTAESNFAKAQSNDDALIFQVEASRAISRDPVPQPTA